MKSLSNWHQKHNHFPLDFYTWNSILKKEARDFLIENKILQYGSSTIDFIEINSQEFQVENIDGKYIAFNDESNDIELSSKDVLGLSLNKNAFAELIRNLLKIGRAVSDVYNSDAFFLGDLEAGNGYKVFLCFLQSIDLIQSIKEVSKSNSPLIISFKEITPELQNLIYKTNGKFLRIDECVAFKGKSLIPLAPINELIGSPRRKNKDNDYYCWSATGFHQPENPNLSMLKITVQSTTRLRIIFDGEGDDFDFNKISILRNESNGKMNRNWILLGLIATKNDIQKSEKTKKQVARLNEAFRDFFGFNKNVIPFSFSDGILIGNFNLTAKIQSKRENKQVLNDNIEQADDLDFRDLIEY